jgi:hypothetical protein
MPHMTSEVITINARKANMTGFVSKTKGSRAIRQISSLEEAFKMSNVFLRLFILSNMTNESMESVVV